MPKKKLASKKFPALDAPLLNPGIMFGSHNNEPVYWAIKPFLQGRIKWAEHGGDRPPTSKKNYKND